MVNVRSSTSGTPARVTSRNAARRRHLLAVVQMMSDNSVATVNRHYFKMEPELMRELVFGWKRPDVDVRSVAAGRR